MQNDLLDKSKMKYVGLIRRNNMYYSVYQLQNSGYRIEVLKPFNYGGESK